MKRTVSELSVLNHQTVRRVRSTRPLLFSRILLANGDSRAHSSRCTVAGENAGGQTAKSSASDVVLLLSVAERQMPASCRRCGP